MFISINWIKDYVDLSGLDIEKLIHQFTLSTAEVEDIIYKGKDVDKVVVGEIVSFEEHPDKEKLKGKTIHILKVDIGDRVVDCVCGAPNCKPGIKVAFACAGGRVPEGEITKCTVYGHPSEGMCCSAKELGISDDHAGIMILDPSLKNGTDIKEIFPIEDIIFEVDNKSLTNRPDLWGHYGIAREIAAITKRELKPMAVEVPQYDGNEAIEVTSDDSDLLYRYSCIKMDNISKNVSPLDMQIRLFYCGMRGINLLADLTNYIMLELGQPTHAFNGDNIKSIRVATPKEDIKFTTLDGVERDITPDTLMIYTNDTPSAIAGIMGGLDSEIVEDSTSVVLESACFDGVSIRKSSQRLSHRTDASMRYEKILDPELTMKALERFVYLLKSIDPDARVASKVTDCYPKKYPEITIEFDKNYVDRYTGIDISNEQILETLTLLGFCTKLEGDNFKVVVPSWRATKDVTIKADIIEEITRIYGYDNFEIKTTKSALKPVKLSDGKREDNLIKDILVKKEKLHEVHSYIWCDEKKYKKLGIEVEDNVKIQNISTSGNGVLRNSLLPTLLTFVYENKSYADDYGMFEIGRVINGTNADGDCVEKKMLGVILYSKTKSEKELYLDAVDMVEGLVGDVKHEKVNFKKIEPDHSWQHPKNTSSIIYKDMNVGTLHTLYPTVLEKIDKKQVAIVYFDIDLDMFEPVRKTDLSYNEASRFPGIDYDISFNVNPELRFEQMEDAWNKESFETLKNVTVIDVYEAEDVRSITLRFSFGLMDRNLTSEEVQASMDKIVANLGEIGVTARM